MQQDDTQSVSSLDSNGTTMTDLTSLSQIKHTQTLVSNIQRPSPRPRSRASHISQSSHRSKASKLSRHSKPSTTQPTKLETKEDLEKHVRRWIQLDNEIRQLQALTRERREAKKQITQDLVDVMRDNEIDFNLSDGKLVYKQSKRTTPLNDKHITACLMEVLHYNPEQAKEVTDAIMSKRKTTFVDTVQRRIDKGAKETILHSGKESLKKTLLDNQ